MSREQIDDIETLKIAIQAAAEIIKLENLGYQKITVPTKEAQIFIEKYNQKGYNYKIFTVGEKTIFLVQPLEIDQEEIEIWE